MKRKRYVKKTQMGTIPERITEREYERTMKDAALIACS